MVYEFHQNLRLLKKYMILHFLDNIQDVVTKYLLITGFSVGISDLIADSETYEKIVSTITKKKQEVKSLIDQTHLGVFENKTVDAFRGEVSQVSIDSASEQEIHDTIQVMGGEDWQLLVDALLQHNALAPHAKTVAYSYTKMTTY